jgi:hypothetical protein
MDKNWLEEGFHWGLHCERHRAPDDAGPFTGGGWKLVWHITVSPWEAVDAMVNTVITKRAEPHFVIGGRQGSQNPVVVQLLPLNVAGRALKHTFKPETNRANCIQIEVCAQPAGNGNPVDRVENFSMSRYRALANLAVLIEHRVEIPRAQARTFLNTKRFGPVEFVNKAGHCGHMHVPGNDHDDPTKDFRGWRLLHAMDKAPNAL